MSSTRYLSVIFCVIISTLVNGSSAGVIPAVSAAYVNTVPYNVPPHGASVNIVQRGLSAPYVAAPAVFPAAAPLAAAPYVEASPYVAASPYIAAPYAPYFSAPYTAFPSSGFPIAAAPILK